MGPYQRTPKEVARAIRFSGLGVRSVGPAGDFLEHIYIYMFYYLLCCCLPISVLHIGDVYRFIFLFAASASSNQAGFGFLLQMRSI